MNWMTQFASCQASGMQSSSPLLQGNLTDTVAEATPAKRKRGKALSRRTGQNGHIEASGKWFVVRFWKDIEGQEKRALVRERISPISGPGSLNRSERERRAREIIADAQVDTAQYFNRVVKQQVGVTFEEQSKIWLGQSQTRKRKPIRTTTVPTIQAALDKWILPEVGHLPLYETAKYPTMKALVTKMNAGRLSAQTVNSYFRMAAAVIASAEDADGNPLYPQKWDAKKLDLRSRGNFEAKETIDHSGNHDRVCQGQESKVSDAHDPRGFRRLPHR